MTGDASVETDSIAVLHVDDDEQMRSLFEEALEHVEQEFTVSSAADPVEALDELDEDVECVVSDYEMPGMDGLEFFRAVEAERPDLPFILLTGRGSEGVASDAMSAGLTDYFRKSDIAGKFQMLAQRIENVVVRERSEVSYRELFERAADGLALNDPETGAFVDANPAFRQMLGLEQSELLSMGVSDIPSASVQEHGQATLAELLRRAATGDVTRTEECWRRPTGERVWVELQFTPIEVKGRSLVLTQARDVTERKRYEQTLSALNSALTEIVAAEELRQVTGSVLSAVEDLLAADRAAVFRHASDANLLEVVDAMGPSSVAGDGPLESDHPLARAFIEGRPVDTDGTSVFEAPADGDSSQGRTLFVPIGSMGVLAVGYEGSSAFPDDDREFASVLATAAAAAVARIEKEEAVHSSEAALRRQSDELQWLEHVTATFRELTDALLRADDREEVFDAVCTRLSAIEGVKLAWIGVPDEDGMVAPSAWDGDIPQYLDAVPLSPGASEEPAVVAARTGNTVRVGNTATEIRRQPWKRTALSHGVESVIAIPLAAGGVTYGVLSVLSADRDAFQGRFADLLSAVASSVAETLHSVEQREGARTGATAAVTFEIDAEDHLLGRLAGATACELEMTGVIAEPEGTSRVFLAVEGASPADVTAVAADMSSVRAATVAVDDGSKRVVELHLEVPLLGAELRGVLARVRGLLATPEYVTATLEVAQPDEVRDVASSILDRYPSARLVSKQSGDDDRSDYERLLAFRESLTPRQREVVHMAYLNGYFESPRQCTGTELGEKLGISSQAVYQHIRAAERQLFEEAFRQVRAVSAPTE